MAKSPYIADANPTNFRTLVLENSGKGPVLVYFWSPRAGPCMMLMPRLVQLAREYAGKFLLVLLDTDQHGRMAREEYDVTSVPTVKFFRQGQVAHTIHGAESDAEFRRAIDKFVARPSGAAQVVLSAFRQEGNVEQACSLLAKAALDDPDNFQIPVDLAKLLLLKGDYAQAEHLLSSLPEEVRDDAEISILLAHAGFIRIAQDAPDIETLERDIAAEPDNSLARYQLGAVRLIGDDCAGAMEQLLEIVRRDRSFRDDAGRNGLIAIFNMVGSEHELVGHYRALLTEALR
jgi:putative thioredoxin